MKTLTAVILAVFLTVSFAQPAHAFGSSERDKIAIALGLAWLFSSANNSQSGDTINLRENCRYSWDKQNCNRRNSIATQWERNVDQYMNKQNEYLSHSADVQNAAAELAELKVYAQKGLDRAQRQNKVQAERLVRTATIQMENAKERMEYHAKVMHRNLVEYQSLGGNPDKLKQWAADYQERMEDFDPNIEPWDQ